MEANGKRLNLTPPQVRQRMMRYCASQERSPAAVQRKLTDLGVAKADLAAEMQWLHERSYWDARRYADAFVRGHTGARAWGAIRIRQALRLAQVPEDDIDAALAIYLPQPQADQAIRKLLAAKHRTLKDTPGPARTAKLVRYLQAKGYRWQDIQPALAELGESMDAVE